MKTFLLKIMTPEARAFSGEVASLTLTSANGLLTVLPGHAPMAAALGAGPLRIRTAEGERAGTAGCGILHVTRKETAVMVESFSWENE